MLLPIIHLILISFLAWKLFQRFGGDQIIFWSGLSVKLIAGWALGAIYLFYYQANDTWTLFEEAQKLTALVRTQPTHYLSLLVTDDMTLLKEAGISISQDRSLFFVRLLSLVNLFSFNNYWIVAAYVSFFSFVVSWFLFRRISLWLPEAKLAAAISFLFLPSVVFWSSGIVKETLALSGLYLMAAIFIRVIKKERVPTLEWVILPVAAYVAWGLKYYWVALFLASGLTIFVFLLVEQRINIVRQFRMLTWCLIFLVLVFLVSFFHPNFNYQDVLEVIISNHKEFLRLSDSNDVIHVEGLTASWSSIFYHAPQAFFFGLFRPFFWEASGLTATLASLENLLLFIAAISALSNIRLLITAKLKPLVWGIVMYSVSLGTLLALSTPNFGTLSRYRVGFLPFLVFILLYQNPLLRQIEMKWKVVFASTTLTKA